MSLFSFPAALAGFVAGLVAAIYWYRASKVQIIPFWETSGGIEPVDPAIGAQHWIIALVQTGQKSGKLNRTAAAWTAGSVVLSAAAALLAVWPI